MFWGVTRLSSLHDATGFDVCKCLPHDIMHVLLEGVTSQEIKLFFKYAIDDLELFTINWFNEEVAQMEMAGTESKDRPSPFDRNVLNAGGHKLNQSDQYKCCILCVLYSKI